MPNRRHTYYVGDTKTFRGSFKIDGVAQTPGAGSAKAKIMQYGNSTAIVAETSATIAGTQISYKYTPLIVGRFAIFLYAAYASAADRVTGVIEFVVRKKEAH